ncbi:TetR/AcrR family transcriptional regulator [uncultured Agrococcus sp.]|uniref:TetR/AcrR family transcriptional regulator n=1 Tax=uncultured Agrococcus sp. TaxID=382258 RepID=UPI0025E04407|nr:TetR/AcrR family transcriptional regulator [uncultured Agrococcus sp.]
MRTANHEERRQQVAAALLRTVAQRGLRQTALVDVANEAGVSVGLVQRYFRTKDDLLRFGVGFMYERVEQRLHNVAIVPPLRELLYELLQTFLPTDEDRSDELVLWLEFLPAARNDQEMSKMHRDATAGLIDAVVEVLSGAQRAGEVPQSVDVRAEALSLTALCDGLSLHLLATESIYDVQAVQRALSAAIDRLFTDDNA